MQSAANGDNDQQAQPIINIMGEKVALGPYHRGFIPYLHRWTNDFEVSILSGDDMMPQTLEMFQAKFEHSAKEGTPGQSNRVEFIIYERESMRIIGLTELRQINHVHRRAQFGIGIGEKDCRHKGYGTEAVRLILDYGFTVLNLHNIMLNTYGYNIPAQKSYLKAGFREIGRRRQSVRFGGQWYDEVLMDCLSSEFQRVGKPVISVPE